MPNREPGVRRREIGMVAFAVALATLTTGWRHLGAKVERAAAPVITDQRVQFVMRGPRYACWLWRFHRERIARFKAIESTTIVAGDSIDAALLVGDPDGELRYFRASRATPEPGPGERVVCIDLIKARVAPAQGVTVHSTIVYETYLPGMASAPHGLWTVSHAIPTVWVPPEGGPAGP